MAAQRIEVTRPVVKVESIEGKERAYRGGVRIVLGEDKSNGTKSKFWLDLQREEALELADKLIARIHRELLEKRKERARRRHHMSAAEYFRRELKKILQRSGLPGQSDREAVKLVDLWKRAQKTVPGLKLLYFFNLVDKTIPLEWGEVGSMDRHFVDSHPTLNRLRTLQKKGNKIVRSGAKTTNTLSTALSKY